MELTRRDAIAALASIGAGGVGYGAYRQHHAATEQAVADDRTVRLTLTAAAEVVYPSEVEGIETFVRTFLDGRLGDRKRADETLQDPTGDDRDADSGGDSGTDPDVDSSIDRDADAGTDPDAGLHRTVATLNERAEEWYGEPFPALSVETRDRLLRELGADTADERPDGTTAERVRYYVVNELLLALYSSPTGGELVGIENPQGHPGGLDSYQRGPR